jgi:hypothetical protein
VRVKKNKRKRRCSLFGCFSNISFDSPMRWMSSSSSISRNNQYKRLNFLYSESLFDLIWQSDSWDTKHQCIFNEIKRMSELTEFACDTTSSRMLDLSISSFVIRRLVSYIIWNVLLFFPSFTLKGPIWYILFLGDLFLSLEKTPNFPVWCFDEISCRILSWGRLPYISYNIITPLEVILHLCYI